MITIPREELIDKLNKLSQVIVTTGFSVTTEKVYGQLCSNPPVPIRKMQRLLLWRFYIEGLTLARPFLEETTKTNESPEEIKALLIALKHDGI